MQQIPSNRICDPSDSEPPHLDGPQEALQPGPGEGNRAGSAFIPTAGEPTGTQGKSEVDCPREPLSQRRAGLSLARRRYQKGTLFLRGKREKVWVGRWLADEIQPDGTIKRIHKSEVLGSRRDFPTKRLAQRELTAMFRSSIALHIAHDLQPLSGNSRRNGRRW